MEYRYVGYSLDEGIVKGKVEADNEASARSEIAGQGYKLLEVKLTRQLPGLEELFPSLFKIGHKDLVRFTQQLAIMVRGGGSLQRALELLEAETHNRVLRRILGSIIKTLDEGGSLSSAMAMHPNVFTPPLCQRGGGRRAHRPFSPGPGSTGFYYGERARSPAKGQAYHDDAHVHHRSIRGDAGLDAHRVDAASAQHFRAHGE